MDKILEVLSNVDVTMESQSVVEVMRILYYRDVAEAIIRVVGGGIVFLGLALVVFTVIKKFGTGEWKS